VSSKIVLDGEAGLGGEPECDVPELRDEKVNVWCGVGLSEFEKVRLGGEEESVDVSSGTRNWLYPDFVRLRMVPTRVSRFGLCCGAAVDGDEGVPLLAWLLAFLCKDGGLAYG